MHLWLTLLVSLVTLVVKAQPTTLFEVSGNGIKTSYFFATSSIRDTSTHFFNDSVYAYLNKCDVFALEFNATADGIIELQRAMFLPEGQYLYDIIDKRSYKYLVQQIKQRTYLEESTIQHLKLYYAVVMATGPTDLHAKQVNVNDLLLAYAQAVGKPVFGIENIDLQLGYLDSLSNEDLLQILYANNTGKANKNREIAAFCHWGLDSLCALQLQGLNKAQERFMLQRNSNIVQRFKEQAQEQSLFVCLNYRHFCGEHNLFSLLNASGYKVKPIVGSKKRVAEMPLTQWWKTWQTYEDNTGKYRIAFPQPPRHQDQNLPTKNGGNLFMSSLLCESNTTPTNIYGLTFTLFPNAYASQLDKEKLLEKALRNFIAHTTGTVIRIADVEYAHVKGKSVSIQLANGTSYAHARLFYRNGILYLLQVLNNNDADFDLPRERFFNSLRFL